MLCTHMLVRKDINIIKATHPSTMAVQSDLRPQMAAWAERYLCGDHLESRSLAVVTKLLRIAMKLRHVLRYLRCIGESSSLFIYRIGTNPRTIKFTCFPAQPSLHTSERRNPKSGLVVKRVKSFCHWLEVTGKFLGKSPAL